jgi:hypothetical protein
MGDIMSIDGISKIEQRRQQLQRELIRVDDILNLTLYQKRNLLEMLEAVNQEMYNYVLKEDNHE